MTRSRHHSRYFEHFPARPRSSWPPSQGTRSQGSLVSLSVQMQIIYPGTALMHLKYKTMHIFVTLKGKGILHVLVHRSLILLFSLLWTDYDSAYQLAQQPFTVFII